MPQVEAKIVVAQAGNPAPGGYTSGSRDGLALDALVTLTNLSNAGVTSWQWEIFPAVGLAVGDYGAAGTESASCTLTPPASTGYGDLAVHLTVRGDPLPGGRANVATAMALLGVRAELSGYDDGLPIVHPFESLAGGKATLSAERGVIGRIAEAIRAFQTAGPGGGGSPSGAAGGDLGGTYPNPSLQKIQGEVVDFDGELLPNSILISETVSAQTRIRQLNSPANGLDAHLLVSASNDPRQPPAWFDYFPGELRAQKFLGTTSEGFNLGSIGVSIAGGAGTQALTTTNLASHIVRLTGAITGDRTITIPSGNGGRAHLFINATTGLYTVRLQGPNGGFCYLLPGQSREVWVDDTGTLRGEALYLCETEIDVSLVGIGSGDTTTSLLKLPAKFALERCERMTIVVPDGDGEYNDSVGFTGSAYDDILSNNAYPMAAVWGLASATEWGSGFSNGYSYSASARTLVYLINGFNQTVGNTVGTVRVRIAGRYFGA